ncbi:Acetyltransferase component of pyruvate dehydrogenase complex [Balamuthia mandrillaris]
MQNLTRQTAARSSANLSSRALFVRGGRRGLSYAVRPTAMKACGGFAALWPSCLRPTTTAYFSASSGAFRSTRRTFASDLPSHSTLGLPALSPTMKEGNLGAWLVKEGDKVSPGDLIADIETDKATVGWEVTDEGYVAKILIPAGTQDIPVGKPAIIMVEEEADVAKFKDYTPPEGAEAKAAPREPQEAPAPAPKKLTEAPPAKETAPPAVPPKQPQPEESGRTFASPRARKEAAELSIDLSSIKGTGPNQRVILADVMEYASSAAKAAAPTARPAAAAIAGDNYTDIPNSNIRKVTAARLSESKRNIPHYYLAIECRVDKLEALRAELNAKAGGEYKLSLNDFIIKAAALALKQKPVVNSTWTEQAIRRYHNVDINVAVNTEQGLFTPLITDADKRGLRSISTRVRELATKAKENKLAPAEFQSGTFTISNLGMYGIKHFAAVINPPQACILAVGGTEKRVVVKDENAKDANERFGIASTLTVTLSCDHRVVDGAVGAEWLQEFRRYMEDPVTMLL